MIRSNGFPHMLYRLWPIGMAGSHLGVITRRCRTRFTWWWPCGMALTKGTFPDVNDVLYMYMSVLYLYEYINIWFILLAHPICLCLAIIVYAVHGSIWCYRWIWWGLATERGYLGSFY